MTEKELEKVQFHFVAHIAMEHEHCTTYSSEDGRLGVCFSVPYKNGHPHGKTRAQYRIDDNVYNTKETFLAALAYFPKARILGIAGKGGK